MYKMNKKYLGTMFVIAATAMLLILSPSFSHAQTINSGSAGPVGTNATTSANTTSTANAQSPSSNNSNLVVKSIDEAISAIKSGDNTGARKSLYEAEQALEGNQKVVDAEKHIEASLQALKDGDSNGAISHADLSKKGLPQ